MPNILSREDFVRICEKSILEARAQIIIHNQYIGHMLYHSLYLNSNPIGEVRAFLNKIEKFDGKFLEENIDVILYLTISSARVANCDEMASYLLMHISRKLTEVDARATFYEVGVKGQIEGCGHRYLQAVIQLKDEVMPSTWEIDAWHPRIIDVSLCPDSTIKNRERLSYGVYDLKLTEDLDSEKLVRHFNKEKKYIEEKIRKQVGEFPKPVPKESTPEDEAVFCRHLGLFSNKTPEDSYKDGSLPSKDGLRHLQQVSVWQKKSEKANNDRGSRRHPVWLKPIKKANHDSNVGRHSIFPAETGSASPLYERRHDSPNSSC